MQNIEGGRGMQGAQSAWCKQFRFQKRKNKKNEKSDFKAL